MARRRTHQRTKQSTEPELPQSYVPSEPVNGDYWPWAAAGYGGLMIVSMLVPADAVSVFRGGALPQVLGWMLLAVFASIIGTLSPHSRARGPLELGPWERRLLPLVLGWFVAISLGHSYQLPGRAQWNGFWQVLSIASCYYIARGLSQHPGFRPLLLLILMTGSVAMAVEGLIQVNVTMPASRAAYQADPDKVLLENGIDAPEGSPARKQFEDRLFYSSEPFGAFALANSLATFLCMGVVVTCACLARSWQHLRSRDVRAGLSLACILIALGLQGFCLLLTRSRTAYVACAVGLGVWLALEVISGRWQLSRKLLKLAALITGALLTAMLIWLLMVDSRVLSEAPKSLGYRLEYWQATLGMIRDRGWTGIGLGNFQAIYPQYKLDQASEIIADPHNWILDIAVTLSLPMAIVIVSWIAVTLVRAVTLAIRPGESDNSTSTTESTHDVGQSVTRGLLIGSCVGGCVALALLSLARSVDLVVALPGWITAVALVGLAATTNGFKQVASSELIAASVAALLSLTISGSWQASGLALPVVSLLAALDRRQPLALSQARVASARLNPYSLIALVGLVVFVLQTWRPVTQAWRWAEEMHSASTLSDQLRLAEWAMQADPLDSSHLLTFSQLQVQQSQAALSPSEFGGLANLVMQRLKSVRTIDPATLQYAGQLCLELAVKARQLQVNEQDFLRSADEFYIQAALRYPGSIELQMQCAILAAIQGDWQSVRQRLDEALRLDQVTPHLDKKLAAQIVRLPMELPGFVPPSGESVQNGFVRAEPLANWLRSKVSVE